MSVCRIKSDFYSESFKITRRICFVNYICRIPLFELNHKNTFKKQYMTQPTKCKDVHSGYLFMSRVTNRIKNLLYNFEFYVLNHYFQIPKSKLIDFFKPRSSKHQPVFIHLIKSHIVNVISHVNFILVFSVNKKDNYPNVILATNILNFYNLSFLS